MQKPDIHLMLKYRYKHGIFQYLYILYKYTNKLYIHEYKLKPAF